MKNKLERDTVRERVCIACWHFLASRLVGSSVYSGGTNGVSIV